MFKKVLLLVFICSSSILLAQKDRKSIDYIGFYSQVAKDKDFRNEEILLKLADDSYFKGQYANAQSYYSRLLAISNQDAKIYFRSYMCLKSVGDSINAENALKEFQTKSSIDWRKAPSPKVKKVLKKVIVNTNDYKVINLSVNSKSTEYAPSVYKGKLIFTSSRLKDSKDISQTGEQFSTTCFYFSQKTKNGKYSAPQIFDMKNIKSKYNSSSACFSKDGKTMYYTNNVLAKEKSKKEKNNIFMLKLSKATLVNGEWSNEEDLPLNTGENNVAHPALSPDGKRLFFVANLPGGFGDTDLYYVNIDDKGKCSAPINLGATINTSGKETFPFVSQNGDFYFSSNGHKGNGGLDIFVAKINADNTFAEIENVGAPINSKADDFSIFIDDTTGSVYISSNRPGGKGFDDIYELSKIKKEIEVTEDVKIAEVNFDKEIKVVDKKAETPLEGVVVSIFDQKNNLITKLITDKDGKYLLKLIVDGVYRIRFEKPNFVSEEIVVDPDNENRDKIPAVIKLSANEKPIYTEDLVKELNLQNIHFALNSAEIMPDAHEELNKILNLMNSVPNTKLFIDVFTDSRGYDAYNLKLSNNRALAVYKWFVQHGIPKDRLAYAGHGETQLKNDCGNGSNCTEEEHAVNRRSEFRMEFL